jgi:hypothetical protein
LNNKVESVDILSNKLMNDNKIKLIGFSHNGNVRIEYWDKPVDILSRNEYLELIKNIG